MLSADQIIQYKEHGYVIPDFVMPEEQIDAIKERHSLLVRKHPEFTDYCPAILQYDEAFVEFCKSDEILNMVAQLIGPDIALWNSSFFAKPIRR